MESPYGQVPSPTECKVRKLICGLARVSVDRDIELLKRSDYCNSLRAHYPSDPRADGGHSVHFCPKPASGRENSIVRPSVLAHRFSPPRALDGNAIKINSGRFLT